MTTRDVGWQNERDPRRHNTSLLAAHNGQTLDMPQIDKMLADINDEVQEWTDKVNERRDREELLTKWGKPTHIMPRYLSLHMWQCLQKGEIVDYEHNVYATLEPDE